MNLFARFLQRFVLPIVLVALCCAEHASLAANPISPAITRVSMTTRNDGGRGLLIQYNDNSDDEDFFVAYVSIPGYTNGFIRWDLALANSYYLATGFGSSATVPAGTAVQVALVAIRGTIVTNSDGSQNWKVDAQGFPVPSASSAASPAVGTTWPGAGSTLVPPANLTVTAPNDGKLLFHFADNSDQEENYEVQLKLHSDPVGSYKSVKDFFGLTGEPAWPFNLNDFFWNMNDFYNGASGAAVRITLVPGKSYDWRLRSVRASNFSAWTEAASNSTGGFAIPSLPAPTNFTAVAVPELENRIVFNWQDNANNEGGRSANTPGYQLSYRVSNSLSNFQVFGTVGRNVSSVTLDPFADPGVAYEWQLSALYYNTEVGAPTDPIVSTSLTTATTTTTFNAPTNLTATVDQDPTKPYATVNISFKDNSKTESGYQVLYRLAANSDIDANYISALLVDKSPATGTNTSGNTVTAVLTSELPPGKSVVLKVRAYNSESSQAFFSASSNQVPVTVKDTFIGELYAPITKDVSFSYTATTSNDADITSSSVTNLPPGLNYDSGTHIVSGTPTTGGLFLCPMSATFASGFSATAILQLRVTYQPAPPVFPVTYATRTIAVNQSVNIPLNTMFADPDTEQAYRVTVGYGQGTGTQVDGAGTPQPTTPATQELTIITYPSLVPQTIANFKAYVDAGDFNNIIFHRAVSSFVVQGGSYKFFDQQSGQVARFTQLASRPSPKNEPGITNARGTIAMAKVGGLPDSANHDFFFSLSNNNGPFIPGAADDFQSLDHQNGGFSVFARVANTGMAVIDKIAGLQKGSYPIKLKDLTGGADVTLSSAITNWPVTGTGAVPASLAENRLVTIKSIVPVTDLLTYGIPNSSDTGKVTVTRNLTNLTLTGVAEGTSTVTLTATDLDGNPSTQTIAVTVNAAYQYPNISQHPVNVTVADGAPASLIVTASGTDIVYQWRKNGVNVADDTNISGATTNTLHFNAVSLADVGSYSVVVSNNANSLPSNTCQLQVLKAPTVTADPLALTRTYGTSASFSVTATGTQPMSYQWLKGGSTIPGAVFSTYTISSVKLGDVGDYSVKVTNEVAFATSAAAHLTVNDTDSDGDGIMDSYEDSHGMNKNSKDSDSDGYEDGLEVAMGTNPALATSNPGTSFFIAQRDAGAALGAVGMKRIPAANLINRLNNDIPLATPAYWLGTYELTNKQFAAVLQRALKQMDIIEVITSGSRRAVRYPKTTGQIVCYLASATAADPPSCEIDMDSASNSFFVANAIMNAPVRAVSWQAAYLTTVVMNSYNGYTDKNVTATWTFDDSKNGYYIPNYVAWEVAARSGYPTKNYLYPTGATAPSAAMAWFNQTAATAKPKNVGSYAASFLGCYDLGGNVAEWVFNNDGTDGYVRGGSYTDSSTFLANVTDKHLAITAIDKTVGIRLALQAPDSPTINTPPANKIVRTDQPLSLSVAASGAPILGYQWLKNNVVLPTQTASTLTIAAPKLSDAGNYVAKVNTNGINPQPSGAAAVSVIQVPITTLSVASGKNAVMEILYANAPAPSAPLTFSWEQNGSAMTNSGTAITGVKTNKLTLGTVSYLQSGAYTCRISSGGVGSSILITFNLTVLRQPNIFLPSFPAAIVGGDFLFRTTYDNDPTRRPSKFTAAPLPPGLVMNPDTGEITGRPTKSGSYLIKITGTNAFGSFTTTAVQLDVNALDAFQPNAVGTFMAKVARHTGAAATDPGLNDNLGGRLDLTTTISSSASGKLTLGTTVLPFTGSILTNVDGTNPTARILIPRKGKLTLRMDLTIDLTTRALTGTVGEVPATGGNPTSTAAINGFRKRWGGTSAFATDYAGAYHNVLLDIPTGTIGTAAVPQGTGYMVIGVTAATGATTLVGKLSDGAAISQSAFVGPSGEHIVFQTLYAAKGSLLGTINESSANAYHYFTGSDAVSWLKKDLGTTSTERNYKAGFNTTLTASGGQYFVPTGTNIVMGLGTGANNARLSFSKGGLAIGTPTPADFFNFDFTIATPAKLTLAPVTDVANNPYKVTLGAIGANGLFTGAFTLSDNDPTSVLVTPPKITRPVTYFGAIVPDPLNAGKSYGRGFFLLPKLPSVGVTKDKTQILSGKATLGAKPTS